MDRADSEPEPRCTVGGWVTIRGRPTRLTELFRVDSVLSLYKGSSEFDVTTFTNGGYADYICYIHRVLAATQVQFHSRGTP